MMLKPDTEKETEVGLVRWSSGHGSIVFLDECVAQWLVDRPRVIIHIAQTVDARISFRWGPSKWEEILASTTPKVTPLWSRVLREEIRPEALLVGSETLLVSTRKQKTLRLGGNNRQAVKDYLPARIVKSVRERKIWSGWHIVVDSKGRIPWRAREMTFWGKKWHPLSIVSNSTPSAHLSLLRRKKIPYIVAGSGRVDLSLAMKKIHKELGVSCVASLGGGRLNGALLRAGLVDGVSVVLIPMIVGGEKTPTSFDTSELGFTEIPLLLRLVSSEVQEDGSIWLRYLPKNSRSENRVRPVFNPSLDRHRKCAVAGKIAR